MKTRIYLAVDLGAGSGRLMAGIFDGTRLKLEELHRFANEPVTAGGSLYWNVLEIFREVQHGLTLAARLYGPSLAAMGVDTWGVDYALLDRRGKLLGLPYAYRDARTRGVMEQAFERMPQHAIYAATGIQFMPINTLFQLYAEVLEQSPALLAADRLLWMPDLLNYWLTGRMVNEHTIASTGQVLDPRTGRPHRGLLDTLRIPAHLFRDWAEPGTDLGPPAPAVREQCGLEAGLKVVVPGCHDTASAVAALPLDAGHHAAYISSGTWSLMGIERDSPLLTEAAFTAGLTHEAGVNGTLRLLKNISGLWMVQECRRAWAAGDQDCTFEQLTAEAAASEPSAINLDPDDPDFAAPGDMPERIRAWCARRGGAAPETRGAMVRAILEGLARKYRQVLEQLESVCGHRIDTVHIMGGGARNALLNQMAADSMQRRVLAGPYEATSLGNILAQMIACGDVAGWSEGRELLKQSYPTEEYLPGG